MEIKKRSRSHSRTHSHSRSRSGHKQKRSDSKSKSKSKDKTKTKSKHRKGKETPEQPEDTSSTPFPLNEGLLTMEATTEKDLITSLNLISDSVAQQRQKTSSAMIHHWLFPLLMCVIAHFIYTRLYQYPEDIILVSLMWFISLMMILLLIQYFTAGYISEAERVGRWSWLFGKDWVMTFEKDFVPCPAGERNGNGGSGLPIVDTRFLKWMKFQDVWVRVPGGDVLTADKWAEEKYKEYKKQNGPIPRIDPNYPTETICVASGWLRDTIFVTRFKGKIIATLVLRVVPVDMDVVANLHRIGLTNTSAEFESVPVHNTCRVKAVIRAWTVMQMYRGHGVGKEILQFAIEWARENGFGGPEFAVDHVNSLRIVLDFYYVDVEKMERRAKEMLIREREAAERRVVELCAQDREKDLLWRESQGEILVKDMDDVKIVPETEISS
ncbi:hypothetical protein N7478_011843 [Penicillium angulare]|uniref:uncharacterized protein n=1 Tax=Penicillium angulare TaxID=116970 RepID=UPI002542352C|nr:uncharacterized protein N7478_011843 [Penicillium angulare]KAJ5261248.1 hypothetical protein N7478_011843 [Penicillium angulare]